MMADANNPNDYQIIGSSDNGIRPQNGGAMQRALPPHPEQKWWEKAVNPVILLHACLGLMAIPDGKRCQRAYCCVHRIFIFVLLLFTCAIQNAVCFRRDGAAVTLPDSSKNETVCDAEQHLIIANIIQEALIITAYTLLVLHVTLWQPENHELRNRIKNEAFLNMPNPVARKFRRLFMRSIIPIWILMSLTARLLHAFAFGLFPNRQLHLYIRWGDTTLPTTVQIVLGSLCLVGFILFDLVYLAVVVSYVIQCELVRKVVDARSRDIQARRNERIALSLEEAVQNIGSIRKYMGYINGKVSWLVSVVFFNFASSTVIGLWSIDKLVTYDSLYNYDFVMASTARAISTVLWVLLLVIPLVQAARLTTACTSLKRSACDLLEEQAAGWANADDRSFQLAELYTLYLNTVSSSLQAKIFGVPIHSWAVYSTLVLLAFVLLLLAETNTYILFSPVV